MDAGVVRRYAERLAEHEATRGFRLIVGDRAAALGQVGALDEGSTCSAPSSPTRSSRGMDQAADPAAEGQRICVELIEELAAIPGVAGVHIMAPANEAAMPR